MKRVLFFLGLSLVAMDFIIAADEPVRTNDTTNVSHQFYDACVQTPKEAIVNLASATSDAASAIAHSAAPDKLKQAGKQLAINAPVKLGYAIKNGAVKAYDATKNASLNVAGAVKDTTVNAAQGTKNAAVKTGQAIHEAASEIGEELKEFGHDALDATASGAKMVYHVVVEKPVEAVKSVAHRIADADTAQRNADAAVVHTSERHIHHGKEISVIIVENPTEADHIDSNVIVTADRDTLVESVEPCNVDVTQKATINAQDALMIEFVLDTPSETRVDAQPLSQDTLDKLAQAYKAVQHDLAHA